MRQALKCAMLIAVSCFGAALLTSARVPANSQTELESLAKLMPRGAILYLEARDFSKMLQEWNDSQVKRDWLASDNHEAFSKSNLLLRLSEAQSEFASAAGIPTDSAFLREASGSQSGIALYDIGKLEFLYIARVQSSDAMRSALWESRAKFEPRTAGGENFYVRTDPSSNRVVAFAIVKDYLVLATREDLIAGALASIGGSKEPVLAEENWYSSSCAAAGSAGDLRLVLNLSALAKSPHFRSYWIQRNVSDLRAYSSEVSDIYRESSLIREERVLLRDPDATQDDDRRKLTSDGMQAAAELAAVQHDKGLIRATANPSTSAIADAVSRTFFPSQASEARTRSVAPQFALTSGENGDTSDLETRIDETLVAATKSDNPAIDLVTAIESGNVNAMLQADSTVVEPAAGFVRIHSAIVLASRKNWDLAIIEGALQNIAATTSTQRLGAQWKRVAGSGATEVYSLDGTFPLSIAVRGKYLMISDSSAYLNSTALPDSEVAAEPGPSANITSANFGRETTNFNVLARALDGGNFDSVRAGASRSDFEADLTAKHPSGFFAGNISSLTRVLRQIGSETLVRRELGDKVFETVTYKFERK